MRNRGHVTSHPKRIPSSQHHESVDSSRLWKGPLRATPPDDLTSSHLWGASGGLSAIQTQAIIKVWLSTYRIIRIRSREFTHQRLMRSRGLSTTFFRTSIGGSLSGGWSRWIEGLKLVLQQRGCFLQLCELVVLTGYLNSGKAAWLWVNCTSSEYEHFHWTCKTV